MSKFQPGQSGNPAGRPHGAKGIGARLTAALLDGEAEELVRKTVELAKAGDVPALRLCLERIIPARKDAPVSFDLPKIETLADAKTASAAILAAVAAGDITPGEAASVMTLLTAHKQLVEATDFEERLTALEAKAK